MAKNRVDYEGLDLEAMDDSNNYYNWIVSYMKKYFGKKVLEVGGGSGTFSKVLTKNGVKELLVLEPSDEMFPLLKETSKELASEVKIDISKNFLSEVEDKVKKGKFDSAVYINVFEHIEDDRAELERLYKLLPKGARICIFVPANPFLMSKFDKSIGHFRRYTKKELEKKVRDAGFEIQLSRRFDFSGVLPWYIKFTLLGSTKMQSGLTKTYDNLVVPVTSKLESVVPPVVGKNVLLVAKKTK